MSRPAPLADPASASPPSLAELRARLDRLDDAIHDLLMARADVVGQVALLARSGKVPFRPGREADIIRRLLARHAGRLPRQVLPRLWRELFAATTGMQAAFAIAVCDPAAGCDMVACAREHFGALTPLRVHASPARALAEVRAGSAAVAVLPLPEQTEPEADAWWPLLLRREAPRLYVAARLPFWAPRPEGAPLARALAVAAAPPDASAQDHTLLGLDLPGEISRARLAAACATAGLAARAIILRRDPTSGGAQALIEVEGHLTEDDPRTERFAGGAAPPLVLGGFAVPVGERAP